MSIDVQPPRTKATIANNFQRMPRFLKFMTAHALCCVVLIPLVLIPRPDLAHSASYAAWTSGHGPLLGATAGLTMPTAGVLFLLRQGFGRYLYAGMFTGVLVGLRLYQGQFVAAGLGAIFVGVLGAYLFRNHEVRAYFDRDCP